MNITQGMREIMVVKVDWKLFEEACQPIIVINRGEEAKISHVDAVAVNDALRAMKLARATVQAIFDGVRNRKDL